MLIEQLFSVLQIGAGPQETWESALTWCSGKAAAADLLCAIIIIIIMDICKVIIMDICKVIIMDICKAPAVRPKVLNKHNTHYVH